MRSEIKYLRKCFLSQLFLTKNIKFETHIILSSKLCLKSSLLMLFKNTLPCFLLSLSLHWTSCKAPKLNYKNLNFKIQFQYLFWLTPINPLIKGYDWWLFLYLIVRQFTTKIGFFVDFSLKYPNVILTLILNFYSYFHNSLSDQPS